MKLQSQLERRRLDLDVDYQSKILLLGSCFAENIGKKLKELKFSAEANPIGVAYNPLSLFKLMDRALEEHFFNPDELDHINERYFSFDLHSQFSSPKKDSLLDEANEKLVLQKDWLQKSDFIFISLGTAWVHIYKKKDSIVNNCHKIPVVDFDKRLLSIQEIVTAWEGIRSKLSKDQKIIFTVSPIRHLKDGFHENQLSKSTLLLAIDKICKEHHNCYYFPSYELMMDELRDYRFYEKDLVHPSELAIDIIWEFFQQTCMKEETEIQIEKVDKLLSSFKHRAFDPRSEAHQKFLKKLMTEMQIIGNELNLNFQQELSILESQVTS